MSYQSFFHCHATDSNKSAKSGGRTASQEADYLDKGDKVNEQDNEEEYEPLTASHEIEYITGKNAEGEGKGKKIRDDLAYFATGNMPKFAIDEAQKNETSAHFEFFRASEEFEPYNDKFGKKEMQKSITFREEKIALPNSLLTKEEENILSLHQQRKFNLERQIELAHAIVNAIGVDKLTYALAIHCKMAALNQSEEQTHIHLEYSDRIFDGIDRPRNKYFSNGNKPGRYKPKHKDEGPCEKDNTHTAKGQLIRNGNLINIRVQAALIINETYEKYGIDKYVFAGTKKELGAFAKKINDKRAVELSRIKAQKHLGPNRSVNLNNSKTQEVLQLKAEAQAINDKYIIIESEKENQKSDIDIEILSKIMQANGHSSEQIKNILSNKEHESEIPIPTELQELKSLSDSLNQQIADIKSKYFTPEASEEIESQTKDRQTIESQVKSKLKAVTKDTHQAAVREHCKQAGAYDEFVINRSDTKNLEWHKNKIIENEARIIAKHFQCENTSSNILLETMLANQNLKIDAYKIANKYDKKKLDSLKRKAESLEKDVTEFDKKYVKPYESEIENLQKNVIQRNNNLTNKIDKLQNQLVELDKKQEENNPLLIKLQEIKRKIENKVTEIDKLSNEHNNYLKRISSVTEVSKLLNQPIKNINELFANTKSRELEIEQLKSDPLTISKDGFLFKNKEKIAHLEKITHAEENLIDAQKKLNDTLAKAKLTKDNLYVNTGKLITSEINELQSLKNKLSEIENKLATEKPRIVTPELVKESITEIKSMSNLAQYNPTLRPKTFKNPSDEYNHHLEQFTKLTGEKKSNPVLDIKITTLLLRQGYPKEAVITAIQQNSNSQGKPSSGYGRAIMTRTAGSDMTPTRNSASKVLANMANQQPDGCTAVALSADLSSKGQLDLSGKTADQIKLAITEAGFSNDR
jgi:hypothetical protein